MILVEFEYVFWFSPAMEEEESNPVPALNGKRSYDDILQEAEQQHHDDGRLTKLRKESVRSDVSGNAHYNRKD